MYFHQTVYFHFFFHVMVFLQFSPQKCLQNIPFSPCCADRKGNHKLGRLCYQDISCCNMLRKGILFPGGGTARNTVWHLANHFQLSRRRSGPVRVKVKVLIVYSCNNSLLEKNNNIQMLKYNKIVFQKCLFR